MTDNSREVSAMERAEIRRKLERLNTYQRERKVSITCLVRLAAVVALTLTIILLFNL